ncbi:alpha-L-rhamnosidase C-terminal domain-containing protein [Formosa undariae]|uniref:Alpha-L-rhamnosidase C-terminal domain-containing protein n=1 Tax=Formosa undariae TaxID=1325436 RepID=A0ABV5EWC0_9FLAO
MSSSSFRIIFFLLVVLSPCSKILAQETWKASWITEPSPTTQDTSNVWYSLRKEFSLDALPTEALAKIAVDSKYWLWVNGEMVVFEGGLKRGPNPTDTYYDEKDIAKFLKKGKNTISVLAWYFGKDGFSHKSSGQFGFLFECITPSMRILSDETWKIKRNIAYETCPEPYPNFRLSESSIRYDARNDIGDWYQNNYSTKKWKNASILGPVPMGPWNNLVLRPIPFWKDFGLKPYSNTPAFPFTTVKDTVISMDLPANLQITPYLKVETSEGHIIEMKTDHFKGGGDYNMYAQYITKKGMQDYESYGWINGHKVLYSIPKGVKVLDLKYRETGYNTEFSGSFNSSVEFLNKIWEKSLRTLYVTMRDTYMDCPDRERAQWWGDEVNEGGEAFYALDTNSHALLKKGMYELIGWQRQDSTLFSPIPAGNWDKELPSQMLTSIGYYGFWNYYLHTEDKQTMSDLYDGVQKYLKIWQINEDGTVVLRRGGWIWGDWGRDKDMKLIFNGVYYLALKGVLNMAVLLDKHDDAEELKQKMKNLKAGYNNNFWTGTAYRHPDYKGKTDDRSQALAVVSGLADADKYEALFEVFKTEEHASPYMEKYVLEALFQMGQADYAIKRMKKRFGPMVNHPDYSTLFEGWGIGKDGFGGGTTNHAWSGGALTILSQYLCGIEPITPGYSKFQIIPNPGSVEQASATVQSVKGTIKSEFKNSRDKFELSVVVPKDTEAIVGIPNDDYTRITLNGKTIWEDGKSIPNKNIIKFKGDVNNHIEFEVGANQWRFEALKK